MRSCLLRFKGIRTSCLFILFVFTSLDLFADDKSVIETFSVYGKKQALPTQPGSAHLIDEKELEKFDFQDIHKVLRSVPGINLQEEDGFGLRPNIGLRGGHPHRSKKVNLMEDGVLIGPAPYSAPAAYYFPHLDKIKSVEVFKGLPSLGYGPNSIGGAINLLTPIHSRGLRAKASYGNFNLQKYQASLGIETYGDFSFDLSRSQHDGFKQLDGGQATGFERNNILFRWDKYFSPLEQNLTVKYNWSNEISAETYLGLSPSDFSQTPYRRYVASQKDKMKWQHNQFFINYSLSPNESWRIRTSVYYHRMYRQWFKLNGFNEATIDLRDVVLNPGLAANTQYYNVLTGQSDSLLAGNEDHLRYGDNYRAYTSGGIQLSNEYILDGHSTKQTLSFDYRFHTDSIRRIHTPHFFAVSLGQLVSSPVNSIADVVNKDRAFAHTLFLQDEIQWNKYTFYLGSRFEFIEFDRFDSINQEGVTTSEIMFAPGGGIFYQAFNNGGLFLGVHKGMTPAGPGQTQANPEEAINYELGIRYSEEWGMELIGFYSDYKNILGTCTQSSGCKGANLDQRINGGKAQVWGIEFQLNKQARFKKWKFPAKLSLTYSNASFANSFSTTLPEWGNGSVVSGDPIPYIPQWQGQVTTGLEIEDLSFFMNGTYVGSVADQAVANDRKTVDAYWTLDLSFQYKFNNLGKIFLRGDNVLDKKYVVSFRPDGLRPGKAQSFLVGIQYDFL